MINLGLALLAALLWGGAYGAYFGRELRCWVRGRRQPPVRHAGIALPLRTAPVRPRPPPPIARPAGTPITARPTAPASNVIPFPRRPRP